MTSDKGPPGDPPPEPRLEIRHMLGLTEASQRGLSRLVREAETGSPTVIIRKNEPVAAILPMKAYYRWLADQEAGRG